MEYKIGEVFLAEIMEVGKCATIMYPKPTVARYGEDVDEMMSEYNADKANRKWFEIKEDYSKPPISWIRKDGSAILKYNIGDTVLVSYIGHGFVILL
jgi:hypothetical protein